MKDSLPPDTESAGSRYPKLQTSLPPNLHARLQAAAVVLGEPAEDLLERALERELASLNVEQRELLDRVAASLISRSELD